jgi:hypothetical protein
MAKQGEGLVEKEGVNRRVGEKDEVNGGVYGERLDEEKGIVEGESWERLGEKWGVNGGAGLEMLARRREYMEEPIGRGKV